MSCGGTLHKHFLLKQILVLEMWCCNNKTLNLGCSYWKNLKKVRKMLLKGRKEMTNVYDDKELN